MDQESRPITISLIPFVIFTLALVASLGWIVVMRIGAEFLVLGYPCGLGLLTFSVLTFTDKEHIWRSLGRMTGFMTISALLAAGGLWLLCQADHPWACGREVFVFMSLPLGVIFVAGEEFVAYAHKRWG